MKKAISIAVCLAMSVSLLAQIRAYDDVQGEKESCIVLTETAKDGSRVLTQYDGEFLYSEEAVSCELSGAEAERLEREPGVIAVSEDIILEGSGKEEKKNITGGEAEQWNLEAIGADGNQIKPSGVKVEVLDSGVSYTDDINIKGEINLVPGEEEVSPMFVDANGHGTGIAGLIGAKDNGEGIKGVCPDAEIYSVKALDENLKSPLSRIVEGIYWGIENDMDIINMSFGTTVNSEVLHQAIKDAYKAGIILIAAAGNTEHQDINYPAAYDEVIAAGSANAKGELAELTSTGAELELLAPGEQVCTTGLFYGTIGVSGTSIATAQVTGAAAMLKAKDKSKTNDFIRGLLKASSKEVDGTDAGLIDCGYALKIYDEYAESYTEGEDTVTYENTDEIADYSNEAEAVVEGLWRVSNDDHQNLIKNSVNKYGTTAYKNQISLMAIGAKETDTVMSGSSETLPCKDLHGKHNYVATLKFLWRFAKRLGAGDSASSAKNNALSILPSKYSKSGNSLRITADNLVKYINSQKHTSSASGKKALIMGVTSHLIGDTYAHRTIVPKSAVTDVGTNPTNSKVGKTHFKSNSSATFTDANLKAYAKSASTKVSGTKYQCWQAFNKTVKLGVMEFIDIKFYMNINDLSVANKIYEDNSSFCKFRYKESQEAVDCYIISFADGFDEFVFHSVYGAVLNNYYGYTKDLGIDTSDFSLSEWKKISTMELV